VWRVSAGALFRMTAEASPVGALARISAQVRVSTSGTIDNTTFQTAGWFLEVFDSGGGIYKGRMVVEANQFAVKTSGTPFIPFAVIGADTYINSLIMGGTLKSANFITGTSGYILRQDGTAEFQDILIAGGTSSSRPFELAFGAIQDGILTDESAASFDLSVAGPDGSTYTAKGRAKRTPTAVEYSITATNAGVGPGEINVASSMGSGLAWAPITITCRGNVVPLSTGSTFAVVITDTGEMRAVRQLYTNGPYTNTSFVTMAQFLNPPDLDPFFKQVYNQTTFHVWKDVLVQGVRRIRVPSQVLVSGVPTNVVGARILAWGAAGQSTQVAGFSGSAFGTGAPGGFVKNDVAVTPGEVLSLIVGGNRGVGFGGQQITRINQTGFDNSSGGGSFIFRGPTKRSSIILAAGGGSCGRYYTSGSPGGAVGYSGGNNPTLTDMRRCMGSSINGTETSEINSGAGGYEGGTLVTLQVRTVRGFLRALPHRELQRPFILQVAPIQGDVQMLALHQRHSVQQAAE
jgi:hypothetical protein